MNDDGFFGKFFTTELRRNKRKNDAHEENNDWFGRIRNGGS